MTHPYETPHVRHQSVGRLVRQSLFPKRAGSRTSIFLSEHLFIILPLLETGIEDLGFVGSLRIPCYKELLYTYIYIYIYIYIYNWAKTLLVVAVFLIGTLNIHCNRISYRECSAYHMSNMAYRNFVDYSIHSRFVFAFPSRMSCHLLQYLLVTLL